MSRGDRGAERCVRRRPGCGRDAQRGRPRRHRTSDCRLRVLDRTGEGRWPRSRRSLRNARGKRSGVECDGETGRRRSRDLRRLLRVRGARTRLDRLARTGVPGDLPAQRGQPRRGVTVAPPRLPPRLHDRCAGRALPDARPCAVAHAHPARRCGPRRYADRVGADDAAPPFAQVRAGLPGLATARSDRTVRGAARADRAPSRGRCVLQSGRFARCRHEPHRR